MVVGIARLESLMVYRKEAIINSVIACQMLFYLYKTSTEIDAVHNREGRAIQRQTTCRVSSSTLWRM